MEKIKVQFILKHRESYWGKEETKKVSLSSGLFNSASFIVDALNGFTKVEAEICHVVDNNGIDKEVTRFKPDIAIIEAYWVVPEKFEILHKLHPNIQWVIRNHSEIPFAAQEGVIMDWTLKYLNYPNVHVSGNSHRSYRDMSILVDAVFPEQGKEVVYLPNIYPKLHYNFHCVKKEDEYLDVACFGAIRPLKNHLMQAVASIEFAERLGKKLRFHVNGGRVEGAGSQEVLKNLRNLFEKLPEGELVEHGWYPHEEFLEVLKKMDMGLQVSFSETFNIVGADMVHVGLPIVASKEVLWSPWLVQADPTDSEDIVSQMEFVWAWRKIALPQWLCQRALDRYSSRSLVQWVREIKRLVKK